ncbi:hypothetical protein AAHB37_18515 [Glutamicibacter halophytocola]|uniref:hypothetical protein n=1 Tax=Glutamicibacter halophytocola TaxID=1933880 RepID=UPI003218F291
MNSSANTPNSERETLKLGTVLLDGLPGSLLTDQAPEKYLVAVVFNRRAEPEEADFLTGTAVKERLRSAGYPDVELNVVNRRLEISNTSLEELRDGLSVAIARELAGVEQKFERERVARNAQFRKEVDAESKRSEAVQLLAQSITFDPARIEAPH